MAFGSVNGRLLLLGRINVTVPGTPAVLSQNTSLAVAGISGSQPTTKCNQVIFKAPGGGTNAGAGNVANVGAVYICYKGGSRADQTSIIADLAPGQSFTLGSSEGNSSYDPSALLIDSDNANDGCRVTLVMSV